MDEPTIQVLVDAVTAIGIGLFIGFEREHSVVEAHPDRAAGSPRPDPALGVRTFALLALFGWLAAYVGSAQPWIPLVALLVIGALITSSFVRGLDESRGLTTEVAALATFLLGLLVHRDRSVAVALALGTTLLLISKPWFRALVPRMRRVDLTATLQLSILFAIVLPLLPEQASDPWRVLSPRRLGMFVALIAGIGYVGYVLHRLLGSQRSAGLTGVIGGLVSSTAVTVAMAQQARRSASMVQPGQLATLLSATVMGLRVLVVAALIHLDVARALVAPLGVMTLGTAGGAAWKWRQLRREKSRPEATRELELKNPFSLLPALKWGALLALILVASAMARDAFGDSGLIATAVISGFVDVDAINLAASRLAARGEIAPAMAALAITTAITANTIVKAVIAWVTGGRTFGADIATWSGAATLLGVGVALASLLRV